MKTYHVDQNANMDRTGDYDERDRIASKWEPIERGDGELNGNIGHELAMELTTGKWTADSKFEDRWGENATHANMHMVMSSPMLLYRTIAMWGKAPVVNPLPDAYKILWHLTVKHKETGEILMLSEWKGSPGFWTRWTKIADVPKSYLADLCELLEFMASNRIPHPYDNTVAGYAA